MKVAILGASDKPERYAHKALKMLEEYSHSPHLVHPKHKEIEGHAVHENLIALKQHAGEIDTLTVYVNPKILEIHLDDIIELSPKRIILNPGTEHPELEKRFSDENIEVVIGCTLVMLRSDQF